jgi:hypothetical protein
MGVTSGFAAAQLVRVVMRIVNVSHPAKKCFANDEWKEVSGSILTVSRKANKRIVPCRYEAGTLKLACRWISPPGKARCYRTSFERPKDVAHRLYTSQATPAARSSCPV